jgi:hypothetical protein
MSYKEKDSENDLFKNNTQYQNFGGIVCCSCSYCAKKTIEPTLTIKNFRSLDPIIKYVPDYLRYTNGSPAIISNKSSIFSTQPIVQYFAERFIPNGTLSYNLDFDGTENEMWYSQDLLNKFHFAKYIFYMPFKGCSGVATSLMKAHSYYGSWWQSGYYNGVYYPLNNQEDGVIKAYGSNFKGSTYYYSPLFTQNFYGNSIIINTCNTTFGGDGSSYNCYSYVYPPGSSGPPPCDQGFLDGYCNNTEIIPPIQPLDPGDYSSLISYIQEHDFSVFGVKIPNNCSNNAVSVLPPIQGNEFKDFQFPFVHEFYEIDNDPNQITRNVQNLYRLPNSLGFMLNYFSYNVSLNSFSVSISEIIPINFGIDIASCSVSGENIMPYDGGYYTYTPFGGFSCSYYTKGPALNGTSNRAFSQNYYPTSGNISITYTDGVPSIEGINCGLYNNSGRSFNNTNNGSIYSTTDKDGLTTLIAKDVSMVGPTLVSQLYKRTQNRYIAGYSLNPSDHNLPIGYLAQLNMGFKCDIELKFQSSPLCRIKDIPGQSSSYIPELGNSSSAYDSYPWRGVYKKFNSVEEFKVNFENIRKVEQLNLTSIDAFYYLTSDNSEDAIFGQPQWLFPGDAYIEYVGVPYGYSSYTLSASYYNDEQSLRESIYGVTNNIVFSPPDIDAENQFVINRDGLVPDYEQTQTSIKKKYISIVFGMNYKKYKQGYWGRIYGNEYEDSEYRNCLLVSGDEEIWKTGNPVKIEIGSPSRAKTSSYNLFFVEDKNNEYSSYGSIPPCFSPTVNAYKQKRILYCIFVKKITDNIQNAGNVLIRLADTYQKSIDNDPIIIDQYARDGGYDNNGFSLQVEYDYYIKNMSYYNAPRYSKFDTNDYEWSTNPNFEKNGISYSSQITNTGINTDKEILLTSKDFKRISFGGIICELDYENIEVISLHPLKIKFINSIFVYNGKSKTGGISSPVILYDYQYPLYPNWTLAPYGKSRGTFGFQCDIVFEENIRQDGSNKHSFPPQFNEILDYETFVQSSGVYNDNLMSAYRNPEKCKHIGKVIDRKDCNCPKKWIRQCDLHETTDWKKCMGCPNFEPDED